MDQNKNLSNEPGKTTGGSAGSTSQSGASGSSGGRGGSGSPSGASNNPSGSNPSGSNPSSGSIGGGASQTSGGAQSSGAQSGGAYGGAQSGSGQSGAQTGSAPQRAREQNPGGGQSTYDQTLNTVSEAYGKTTEVLGKTYDEAMSYGRENPGKLTLIAFGAGIGIGLLLAGTGGRSRTNRIAEPVVNALSQVAMEFFR